MTLGPAPDTKVSAVGVACVHPGPVRRPGRDSGEPVCDHPSRPPFATTPLFRKRPQPHTLSRDVPVRNGRTSPPSHYPSDYTLSTSKRRCSRKGVWGDQKIVNRFWLRGCGGGENKDVGWSTGLVVGGLSGKKKEERERKRRNREERREEEKTEGTEKNKRGKKQGQEQRQEQEQEQEQERSRRGARWC